MSIESPVVRFYCGLCKLRVWSEEKGYGSKRGNTSSWRNWKDRAQGRREIAAAWTSLVRRFTVGPTSIQLGGPKNLVIRTGWRDASLRNVLSRCVRSRSRGNSPIIFYLRSKCWRQAPCFSVWARRGRGRAGRASTASVGGGLDDPALQLL